MVSDDTRLFRRRALLLALVGMVIVFFLWNIPQLDFILYPFRLFVTFVHEAGHGLASLVTGGQFHGFEVYGNGAGQAITSGGSRVLILPAGYLGAALFGAVLFYLVNTLPYPRTISRILGVVLVVFSLLFSRLISAQFIVSIAPFVGVISGVALFLLGSRGSRDLNILVLNILAMLTALNVVMDLVQLVQFSNIGLGQLRNDAAAFSAEFTPAIPAAMWALIWALLAVALLGVSVWYSVIHPLRKGE
jgi:hypothetical protein